MKALTLHQPHADLVRRRLKIWETRGWRTEKHVGEFIVIHASKTRKHDKLAVEKFTAHYVLENDPERQPLAHSECLCVVELIGCHPTAELKQMWEFFLEAGTTQKKHSIKEQLAMGDYKDGRWGWHLKFICDLKGITGVSGKQRLWELPEEIAAEVYKQMREAGVKITGGGGQTETEGSELI